MTTLRPAVYSVAAGRRIYGGSFPTVARIGESGDSMESFVYKSRVSTWGYPLTLQPPMEVFNLAHSGDTSADWLGLLPTIIAAAVSNNADAISTRIGTNGPGAPGSGAGGVGSGDVATDIATGADMCAAAGFPLLVFKVTPEVSGGAARAVMNAQIAAVCAARPDWTFFLDDCVNIADEDYNANPGMLIDTRHLSFLATHTGGLTQAEIVASAVMPLRFQRLFDTDPRISDPNDTYEINSASDQYVVNPFNSGTGGTVENGTGECPDDMSVNTNGTSTIIASITPDSYCPWVRMELASGEAGKVSRIGWTLQHPVIPAGMRRIYAVVEVRMSLNTANLNSFSFGAYTAGPVDIAPSPDIGLGGLGTFTAHVVLSQAFERTSMVELAANSMALKLSVLCENNFASSAGWIEARLASARGIML